jgi:hypothetical protein
MKRSKTPSRKGAKTQAGAPSPLVVNLLRVGLVIVLLVVGIRAWKGRGPEREKPTIAIAPKVWEEGPSPYYLSQKFSFKIDGVSTLRGFSGHGDAPRLDKNILGNTLKVKGKGYEKGIGTAAASEIVFALDRKVSRFSCLVGVDEQAGGTGSVRFVVKADGKKIFESPVMRSDTDPLSIDLSLSGVKELALVLDPNGPLDSDFADWLDLKFRKGGN